ncbi:DUF3040 domain-containing protein [Streptacidiphilus fuscans]|uniref:DUF3040 domain-containing protein n=1 Tax=Streptacidiphilus fuscans TaxID=2789292 RepID=A0A931BCM9_9ACTN|nr:DUF3040 domain-containing protein [Streptacidiphilus fuscans]MBF9070995.1 DUF3040 domain-containing protein [Streptacidiphilus fuscans]
MPLSEHEQRLLEQMERALYAEDPKFATALEGSGLRTRTRRAVYASVAGFVVGVGLLMGGLFVHQQWVSVVGFVLMLAGAVFAVTAWRRIPRLAAVDPRTGRPVRRKKRGGGGGSIVDRMEQRWQRRQEQQRGGF